MSKIQLNLDFSAVQHPSDGKKLEKIPVACSDELKSFVSKMADLQKITVSELAHRYIVEGLKEDVVRLFIPEPHLDKSLRDLLSKFK
jgi:hypothetical protein